MFFSHVGPPFSSCEGGLLKFSGGQHPLLGTSSSTQMVLPPIFRQRVGVWFVIIMGGLWRLFTVSTARALITWQNLVPYLTA
ncbi:hypothetical protein BVC80_5479g1 [Macleaya cordata]|uniref:Uncharacterized protein n=1 Tax=Macleaya cordata TaxID=56857 RepID=A0A200R026_MACCD|nr:hypothetical protein BVC80_5479g1 [Macleaya cordata]